LVKAGELIAQIDPGTYKTNFIQAESNLASAKAALEYAKINEARAKTLRADKLNAQAEYDAGPYEQAARVFREHGYPREAEQILIAQGRHARRAFTGRGAAVYRLLNRAFDVTVRFGYRPGRVLWAIIVLLAAVAISLAVPGDQAAMRATSPGDVVYTPHRPVDSTASPRGAPIVDACGQGKVRCFNPIFYAVDTVVPLISLDQRSTWYPDPHVPRGTFMQWWLNIATLLGWLLSSIFVLSLARLARGS